VSGFRFRPGQATGDIYFRTTVAQTLVLTASDRAEEILPGSEIVIYSPDVAVAISLGGSPTGVPQGLCSPAFSVTPRDQILLQNVGEKIQMVNLETAQQQINWFQQILYKSLVQPL
jgi:hypothetical protein